MTTYAPPRKKVTLICLEIKGEGFSEKITMEQLTAHGALDLINIITSYVPLRGAKND